ncbi:sulfatase-like hydrolase/transferase [Roseimaritima ulvae]|uniref:Arylsulfatase n=1 Tax=Roseimaritima ulvae TaxID=980254 RepID=A0A5B9QHN1_9BACT|nr:sulfatase-like hydrolase/transferase [Roseimaritima ulvae]QEG38568.1 Arylsulfatase [Roseimaritima ulvae]
MQIRPATVWSCPLLLAAATLFVWGGLFVPAVTAADKANAKAAPPNIVYIMADELGYYELSCMGNPHIQTPHIDRMAKQGVRFTQALAGSSVCAPTRGCLMTGKHSGHTSVRSNGGGTPLRAGEETIASMLKPAGYATGGFGKWGCGGRGSTGVPEEHGFDVFLGYYDQVHAHSYYPPYIVRNSEEVPLAGNKGGSDGDTYSHYVIVDAAHDFIREHRDQPFFCYMPITPPHGIFDIPDSDPAWQIYKDKDWPEQAKRYAAMVSMVDRQVGETLELLRSLELDDNTIVFFCGDNGGADYFSSKEYPRGFHGANVHPETGVEFRGKKGNLYEGGLRIPMIVRWPGHIAAGRVSDLLWYFPDVMPTVAELAAVKVPSDLDGMSIVPELLGAETAGRAQPQHDFLYWELGQQIAVRQGDWKAIQPGKGKPWELYDLATDVSETKDLAKQQPQRLAAMQQLAAAAHEPVEEGTFHNREIHEKDRLAKYGGRRPAPRKRGKPLKIDIPAAGLVPTDQLKVAAFSSQNASNGKLASNAIDGDANTVWHSRFTPAPVPAPHSLVIDLGATYEVSALWYVARQDGGWNGTVADVQVSVGDDVKDWGDAKPVKVTLEKTRQPQAIKLPATRGRYVRIEALSEVNGGPWASAAEIAVEGSKGNE